MATLLRSALKLGCNLSRSCHLYRLPTRARFVQPTCCIFTSKKKKDSAAIANTEKEVKEVDRVEDLLEKEENWMSHGYDYFDRDYDEWAHHMIMFTFVTCPTVLFMLYIFYFPDHQDRSWEKREALMELARREKLGLPLIDINYIDPSKIYLPSDEELADLDIII